MNCGKEELRDLFSRPFDEERWGDVLGELFGVKHDRQGGIREVPQELDRPFPEAKGWFLGSFTTADGYLVGLFRFEANSVRRRRVGLRNLLKPMLRWTHDAALAVFTERGSDAWRFSFVCDLKDEATAPKRFTYVFGDPASPCRTPVQRFLVLRDAREAGRPVTFAAMQDAFSVEALSDEFFREYKNHYETFVSRVTGKRFVKEGGKWVEIATGRPDRELYRIFGNDDKLVRDYVKKLLGRLVFLHFLQKKGWLGARRDGWTGGDPAFLLHLFERATAEQQADFLDGVLENLFFNALNTDRSSRGDLFDTGVPGIGKCRIPYLNGGLFERDELDELRVRFPAAYFRDLLRFFAEYNFTIDENDADEAEVGIDPEMLGRIFENLLEDNKDKGAFYTPKEIVRYMCRQSLLAYLSEGEKEKDAAAIAEFLDTRESFVLSKALASRLAVKLRDVKICDPAIGSGAFPMGLLRELSALRSAIDPDAPDLKRQIIENNIYGVDIEKGAVDIARLRFWLALVVDADEPTPLPNLDFKIMQGNSLVESWKGHDLSGLADGATTKTLPRLSLPGIPAPAMQLTFFDAAANPDRIKLRKLLHQWFACSDHAERAHLRQEIRAAVESIFREQGSDVSLDGIDVSSTPHFFLWHLWFAEVFDHGGFDIVIGNPPYVNIKRGGIDPSLKAVYEGRFKTASGQYDLFTLFIELGAMLGNVFTFIVPKPIINNENYEKAREILLESGLRELVLGHAIFPNAAVESCIFLCQRASSSTTVRVVEYQQSQFCLKNTLPIEFCQTAIGHCFPVALSVQDLTLMNKLNDGLHPCLDSLFDILRGVEAGKKDSSITFRPNRYKLLRGEDMTSYSTRHAGLFILFDGRNTSKFKTTELYFGEKILVRRVANTVQATFDGDDFVVLNTIYCLHAKFPLDASHLKFFVGLLNSRLLGYWFFKTFTNTDTLFPYIRSSQLGRIPLCKWTRKEGSAIERLVDRILASKSADPAADTTAEERRIDELVYGLYGLTPDEIAAVESENA